MSLSINEDKKHPVAIAAHQLSLHLNPETLDKDSLESILQSLMDIMTLETNQDQRKQSAAEGTKNNLIQTMLKLLEGIELHNNLHLLLGTIAIWLTNASGRTDFFDASGHEATMKLVEEKEDLAVVESCAKLATAACFCHEGNKCRFVAIGFPLILHTRIKQETPPDSTLIEFSRALCSFCNPDDTSSPTSEAFRHARFLASEGIASTLVSIASNKAIEEPNVYKPVLVDLLRCVKSLAANDDICQKLLREGTVSMCLRLWKTFEGRNELIGAAAGLLRQMSQCDPVKHAIISEGGAGILTRCVTFHVADAALLEIVIGLMTNIVLRQPGFSQLFHDEGCIQALSQAARHQERKPRVLKQICMFVRNIVSRVPDVRTAYLEEGFEEIFRSARTKHPKVCGDVGSAALRDLGLDYT